MLVRRLLELDLDALDPRALDLQHLEAAAVVCGLVARLRLPAEQAEDEASDRVVVLDRERPAELLVEVVDRKGAVDPEPPVLEPLDRFVGEVELVLDLADDL